MLDLQDFIGDGDGVIESVYLSVEFRQYGQILDVLGGFSLKDFLRIAAWQDGILK